MVAQPIKIPEGETREIVSPSEGLEVEIQVAEDSPAAIQIAHNRSDLPHAIPRQPGRTMTLKRTVKHGVGLYARPVGGDGTFFISEVGADVETTYNDRTKLAAGDIDIGNVGVLDDQENRIHPAEEDGNLAAILAALQGTLTVGDDGSFEVDASAATVPTVADNQGIQDHGQDTVASSGAAEQLNGGASSPVPDGAVLWVKALAGNSDIVYVGDNAVDSGNGFELSSGESIPVGVEDVDEVWIDVDTDDEGVSWIVA